MYRETDLRKHEHYRIACCNVSARNESMTIENSYFNKIDTLDKKVKIIHTSDNDGEVTTYDVDVFTKDGILQVVDGRGNKIVLNSKTDNIHIETGTSITMKTKTIDLECDTYKLKAKSMTIDSNSINSTIGSRMYKGSSFDMTISSVSLTGNFTVNGSSKLIGGTVVMPPLGLESTVAKT
jgi:hypothetical protein